MNITSVQTPNIVRIERSATLDKAAALMRERHVGALIVSEDQPYAERTLGIVTDRDLVIKAMAEGIAPRSCTVGEVMTPALATVLSTASVSEALRIMRTRGIRRLVVGEPDGKLVGIVSLDDIIDMFGAELAGLSGILRNELEREMGTADQRRNTHLA